MTKTIYGPGNIPHEFPDDMSDDAILAVMKRTYGGPGGTQATEDKSTWTPRMQSFYGAAKPEARKPAYFPGLSEINDAVAPYTRRAIQGASFGIGKEINAAGQAAVDTAGDWWNSKPTSFADNYVGNKRVLREIEREDKDDTGWSGFAGELLGGLATGVPKAAASAVASGVAATAPTLRQSVATGAKYGAGYGAAAGAINSEGDLDVRQRLEDAALGSLGGTLIGGAVPVAWRGVKLTILDPIQRAREALRRAREARASRAKSVSEAFVDAGIPEFPPAIGGPTTQKTAEGLMKSVGGGSLRNSADRSITALESKINDALDGAGANRPASDIGTEVQQFLTQSVTGRTKNPSTRESVYTDRTVRTMDPADLQDRTGIAPGPRFNPQAPTVDPVLPDPVPLPRTRTISDADVAAGMQPITYPEATGVRQLTTRDVPVPPELAQQQSILQGQIAAGSAEAVASRSRRDLLLPHLDDLQSQIRNLTPPRREIDPPSIREYTPNWESVDRLAEEYRQAGLSISPKTWRQRTPQERQKAIVDEAAYQQSALHELRMREWRERNPGLNPEDATPRLQELHAEARRVQIEAERHAATVKNHELNISRADDLDRQIGQHQSQQLPAMQDAHNAVIKAHLDSRYADDVSRERARTLGRLTQEELRRVEQARTPDAQSAARKAAQDAADMETARLQADVMSRHEADLAARRQRPPVDGSVTARDRTTTMPDDFTLAYGAVRANTPDIRMNVLGSDTAPGWRRTATLELLTDVARTAANQRRPGVGYTPVLDGQTRQLRPEVISEVRRLAGNDIGNAIADFSRVRTRGAIQPTIESVDAVRRMVGRELGAVRRGESSADRTFLERLTGSLKADVDTILTRHAAPESGGTLASTQRNAIDRQYEEYIHGVRTPLRSVIGSKEQPVQPAQALDRLIQATRKRPDATSGAADVQNMRVLEAYYRVAKEKGDVGQATGALLHRMAEGGVPGFVANMRGLSPEARRLMFQGPTAQLGRTLDDLARAGGHLERYIKPARQGVDINSVVNTHNVVLAGLHATFGLPTAIAGVIGQLAASRLMASPRFASWLRSYPNIATRPQNAASEHFYKRMVAVASASSGVSTEMGEALLDAIRPSTASATFLGEKSPGANKESLDMAMSLERDGRGQEHIFHQTGWFRLPTGEWSFETDDSKSSVTNKTDGKLSDVYDNDELYKKDPRLSGVPVKSKIPAPYNDPRYEGITVMPKPGVNAYIAMNPTSSPSHRRSIVAHETQHAADNLNGFTMTAPVTPRSERDIAADPRDRHAPQTLSALRTPYEQRTDRQNALVAGALHDELYTAQPIEDRGFTTAKRLDLTAEQRRERPPWMDFHPSHLALSGEDQTTRRGIRPASAPSQPSGESRQHLFTSLEVAPSIDEVKSHIASGNDRFDFDVMQPDAERAVSAIKQAGGKITAYHVGGGGGRGWGGKGQGEQVRKYDTPEQLAALTAETRELVARGADDVHFDNTHRMSGKRLEQIADAIRAGGAGFVAKNNPDKWNLMMRRRPDLKPTYSVVENAMHDADETQAAADLAHASGRPVYIIGFRKPKSGTDTVGVSDDYAREYQDRNPWAKVILMDDESAYEGRTATHLGRR